ncbi:NADPH-dependent FMN reductase [Pandoraea communis]|uniref:NADPH-dependent FMN reductase n=3 Tax=Pandoraea communis TaxID=2508297 RepID=A0A5E4TUP8_9BURK|nr:NADPH-dependent FMN reductase [Pandoraea communis]
MLASLRLVLSTVSDGFLEPLFLRVPLIGKSPEEIADVLSLSGYAAQISAFLSNFVEAIRPTHGEQAGSLS